ncbi:MAG TPA: 2-oxo acid dehydrogenase subunit E2 [Candidatus Krumholzibacteria bacterium]|nr:2-oxo acid dehydrogenase subunit E2 [Candidatus Krumholzibacteria bacterium]
MIVEVRLPEISENVASGDVTKVLVKTGDRVEMDQPLIELETEKAVFEVPSTAAGIVTDIRLKPGDSVDVGGVIAKIDTEAKQGASSAAGEAAQKEQPEATQPKPAPAAQRTEEPRPAANPPQPTAARPVSQDARPAPAPSAPESTAENIRDTVVAVAQEQGAAVPASPTVRRMARELGVDINKVHGSGPGGRISSEDVSNYAKSIISGTASSGVVQTGPLSIGPGQTGAAPQRQLPDFSRFGEVERTPMSKVRAITAQTMAYAWNTVPHVTQHDEADITALETARKKYALRVEQRGGGKLTVAAILTKVCASALRRFPDFNASIDMAHSEIVHKKYVNIGIAVDTDRGLLVPVLKGADGKNLIEIAADLTQLAEKARTKKIMPDDLEGGCFTISNLGGIGGVGFTPIVYAPEVAILGISRASMKPVYINNAFEPRLILPLSLSYDHRLIDGAAAARFLRWVCEALEDPILLAIEG